MHAHSLLYFCMPEATKTFFIVLLAWSWGGPVWLRKDWMCRMRLQFERGPGVSWHVWQHHCAPMQVWFQNRRSKERRMKQLSALGARRHAFFRGPRRMRTLGGRLEDPDILGPGAYGYYGGKMAAACERRYSSCSVNYSLIHTFSIPDPPMGVNDWRIRGTGGYTVKFHSTSAYPAVQNRFYQTHSSTLFQSKGALTGTKPTVAQEKSHRNQKSRAVWLESCLEKDSHVSEVIIKTNTLTCGPAGTFANFSHSKYTCDINKL